jgi:hypothetical protein
MAVGAASKEAWYVRARCAIRRRWIALWQPESLDPSLAEHAESAARTHHQLHTGVEKIVLGPDGVPSVSPEFTELEEFYFATQTLCFLRNPLDQAEAYIRERSPDLANDVEYGALKLTLDEGLDGLDTALRSIQTLVRLRESPGFDEAFETANEIDAELDRRKRRVESAVAAAEATVKASTRRIRRVIWETRLVRFAVVSAAVVMAWLVGALADSLPGLLQLLLALLTFWTIELALDRLVVDPLLTRHRRRRLLSCAQEIYADYHQRDLELSALAAILEQRRGRSA